MAGATTQVDHCPVCDSALPTDPGESNCTTCGSAIHPRVAEGRAVAEQGWHPYFELVGTTLGERYQILSLRGRGGMGVVFHALDVRLREEVAIKLILPGLETGFSDRFFAEARRARDLVHENIVRVYNLEVLDGTAVLVMELLHGMDLKERLRRGGVLPIDEALRIGIQACRGLEYAHMRGFVHRDIKPQNLFLTEDGTVKVLDFGVAKAIHDDPDVLHTAQTQTGGLIGTPAYMSPEQAMRRADQRIDTRADIYAMGILLYECVTGQLPFRGESSIEVVVKQLNEKPLPPSQLRPNLPLALEQTILKALEKDREARQQSVRELHDSLQWIAEEALVPSSGHLKPIPRQKGTEKVQVRPGTATDRARRPTADLPWRYIMVAAAVVLALAVGLIFIVVGDPPTIKAARGIAAGDQHRMDGRLVPGDGKLFEGNAYEAYSEALDHVAEIEGMPERAHRLEREARQGLKALLTGLIQRYGANLTDLEKQLESYSPGAMQPAALFEQVDERLEAANEAVGEVRRLFGDEPEVDAFEARVTALNDGWPEKREVHERLAMAEKLMDQGNWVSPKGNNALEEIRGMQLDHPQLADGIGAQASLSRIQDHFKQQAREQEIRARGPEGDTALFAALDSVKTALRVALDDPDLTAWGKDLEQKTARIQSDRQRQQSAAKLVKQGDQLRLAGFLVSPAGGNAEELYMLALAKAPGNDDAMDGLRQVRESLLQRGRAELARKEPASALEAFQAAADIPGQTSEVEPLIARAQSELDLLRKREANEREVRGLLASAQTSLQQDSLVGPRGRSALDLYRRIFELSPGNSEALAGIAAVRTRLVELAAKARDRGSLEDERELLEQSQGIERTAEVVDRLASIQSELARHKEEVERLEREEQIRALVSKAIKERSAGRLEEAFGTYEELQRIDPSNTDMLQGIATIRGRLIELGDQGLAQKDIEKARDYFRRAKDAGAAEADQRLKSVVAKIEERKVQDRRERLLREQELAERQRTRAESEQLLEEARRALEAGRARDAVVKVKAGEAEDPSVPGATELRVSVVRSLTDSARGHLAKARVDDALRDLQAAEEIDAGSASAVKSSFVDEVLEATRSPQCDQIAQVQQRIQVASRVMPNDSRLGLADSRLAQSKARCEGKRVPMVVIPAS
ncbi:MAG: protein kinase [Gammaproteobacteria bacterium]|nr:protein kinase [Gammaproteobacteria bacterium]